MLTFYSHNKNEKTQKNVKKRKHKKMLKNENKNKKKGWGISCLLLC